MTLFVNIIGVLDQDQVFTVYLSRITELVSPYNAVSAQMSPLGGMAHATAKRQITIWCVIYDGLCRESWPRTVLPPQNIIVHKRLENTCNKSAIQAI